MEKPVLFNTEMVKAILEDRKNTTRRIIKGVKGLDFIGIGIEPKEIENTAAFGHGNFKDIVNARIEKHIKAPYLPEDILYVRETWLNGDDGYHYKADSTLLSEEVRKQYGYKWKPSIHMPQKAARIFLKVIDVRVERLQDITEEQVIKEGCEGVKCENIHKQNECRKDCTDICMIEPPQLQFLYLWNSTLTKNQVDMYGWNANPWVWVIEFERIKK